MPHLVIEVNPGEQLQECLEFLNSATSQVADDMKAGARLKKLRSDLEFFYSVMNPAKVADVTRLIELFGRDEETLNAQLRTAYGLDLSSSQELISNVLRTEKARLDKMRRDVSERRRLMKAEAERKRAEETNDKNVQSEDERGSAAAGHRVREDGSVVMQRRQRLKEDLEFFYSVMNPAKVADVPSVVEIFGEDEESLNAQLRKAYGLDLTASDLTVQRDKLKLMEDERKLSMKAEHLEEDDVSRPNEGWR